MPVIELLQARGIPALCFLFQLCTGTTVLLGRKGWETGRRRWVPIVLGAMYLLQLNELYGTLISYSFVILRLAVFILLVACWTGRTLSFSICLGLCLDLVIGCCDTVFRFVGMRLIGVDYLRAGVWYKQLAATLLLAGVELVLFQLLRVTLPELYSLPVPLSRAIAVLVTALPYYLVSNLTVWVPLENEQLTLAVPVLLSGCCLVALFSIVNSISWLAAERGKQEEQQRRHILELQQQQFLAQRASEDAVRRQYHDMKNLLLCLEHAGSTEQARRHIRKLLDNIRPYEQRIETGCDTADAVLGQKLALCQEKGIVCSVSLDGGLLSGMDSLDISCLLGNALDNAIEACERLTPEYPRKIQVRSARRGDFAVLHFRNTVPERETMEPDFQTSKPDRENHGFGIRNMRHTIEKYGGQLSAEVQDGEFLLTILLPHQE